MQSFVLHRCSCHHQAVKGGATLSPLVMNLFRPSSTGSIHHCGNSKGNVTRHYNFLASPWRAILLATATGLYSRPTAVEAAFQSRVLPPQRPLANGILIHGERHCSNSSSGSNCRQTMQEAMPWVHRYSFSRTIGTGYTPTTTITTTKRYMSKKEDDDSDEEEEDFSIDKEQNEKMKKLGPRKMILALSPPEDHAILNSTVDWVERAVIGLNLCPFAERPLLEKLLHIEVVRGTDQVEIMARVLAECFLRQYQRGRTSLLVCPDLFPNNFDAFLEVYNMIQDGMLVEHDLTEFIQVAPFHPLFEFDGSGSNGIDNLTNRSPYPIFHILREEGKAVDALQGDASKVWKRNVRLLEGLAAEFEDDQCEDDEDEDSLEKVAQILRGGPLSVKDQQRVKDVIRRLKRAKNDDDEKF